MTQPDNLIHAVLTNIITGFLGVGKTSAILHLLKHKPANERWAVLVNEFGEIGIDGNLMTKASNTQEGVFIKEVPGGCMCCAANLSMQIALNQLLAQSRPHRLLIEPTGLGHPKEIIDILTAPHYHQVVSLQRTLTLVDARKFSDVRYTSHETFHQQLDIADCIVANKQALYAPHDKQKLNDYLSRRHKSATPVLFTDYGEIPESLLRPCSVYQNRPPTSDVLHDTVQHKHRQHDHHHTHSHQSTAQASSMALPDNGFLKATNHGEGFQAIGWRIAPRFVFSRAVFKRWISSLEASRVKAVMITDEGTFGYNCDEDAQTEIAMEDDTESRLEIIAPQVFNTWEQELKSCIKA